MIDFTSETHENGVLVIRLGGNLDAESNEYFFECVESEIESGHRQVVINCADLGYVSSIGLGSLVRARSRVAKTGGTIYLCCIDSPIMDVFRVINFDRIFKIFATEKSAIEAIENING